MLERNIIRKLIEFGLLFWGFHGRSGLSHSETSLLGEATLEKGRAEAKDLLLVPGSSGQDGELPAWFSGNVGVPWVLHP